MHSSTPIQFPAYFDPRYIIHQLPITAPHRAAHHSSRVRKAAGDLQPGQAQYGWRQCSEHKTGWGELSYSQKQRLPLKCLIEQQFKATRLSWAPDLYALLPPGLFRLSAANPTNRLHPSWSVCSLREWIYICPGFLCGILGFSISHTHYTQLSISSTSRSA